MNHHTRSVDYSPISSEEARASVSPRLTVEAESLCYVPSSGLNETLCYEFTCSAENGDRVLVYINAQTALEEQILILLQSDNGDSGDVAFSRTLMPGSPPVKSDKAYSKGSPARR